VDEHGDALGGEDHEGVRVELEQLPADRRHDVQHLACPIDGGPGPGHELGEHGVGHLFHRNRSTLDRGENGRRAHTVLLGLLIGRVVHR
jgi:hypothetical protein